jgi:hypothetical protein
MGYQYLCLEKPADKQEHGGYHRREQSRYSHATDENPIASVVLVGHGVNDEVCN